MSHVIPCQALRRRCNVDFYFSGCRAASALLRLYSHNRENLKSLASGKPLFARKKTQLFAFP
jgi:hypothetical protein